MNPSNQEIQLRKTCQLYTYVLESLNKEVPEEIQECSGSYEYPVNCTAELFQVLDSLDSDTFKKIVHDTQSEKAHDLSNWWEMYKIYIPLNSF